MQDIIAQLREDERRAVEYTRESERKYVVATMQHRAKFHLENIDMLLSISSSEKRDEALRIAFGELCKAIGNPGI